MGKMDLGMKCLKIRLWYTVDYIINDPLNNLKKQYNLIN